MDTMDITTNLDLNETLNTTVNEDYEEPAWKSKTRSAKKAVSYSRANANKFLDKEKADENRELYLDLFDEDPNKSVCDNQQFEQELFSDIKDDGKEKTKLKRKRVTKKKKKDDENPEFLGKDYKRKVEQQKDKLQKIFEESSLYRDLQALKSQPLNIQEIDCKGNTVKRLEYYFDFEENKHNFVEVKNDEDYESDQSQSLVKPVDGQKEDDASSKDKQFNKQSKVKEVISKNKSRIEKDDDDDDIERSTKKKEKVKPTVVQQKITERPSRSTRNLKRKSYVESNDASSDEEFVEKQKRKRKTTK